MGLHVRVHVGVHEHQPGLPHAVAGHLAAKGQLGGRDQTGTEQLGTCRRDRRPGGHSIAPAGAPAILAIGSGNYGVLYAVAGIFAIIGAVAILPVGVSDKLERSTKAPPR